MRKRNQNEGDKENPRRAPAVNRTLTAVTRPVPHFFISLTLNKAESMVEAEIAIETNPALPRGRLKSPLITGQAAPSIPSGKPRLINAK
jgi:hypothetical protein